jgi:hypothetical protein
VDGGRGGVTLSDTLDDSFDLLEIAPGDTALGEGDHFDSIEIPIGDAVGDGPLIDDDREEPTLAATPFFIEFDEPAPLDPERAGLIWELHPALARSIRLRSPLASLVFHLLPLLGIIIWPLMMIEPPAPIPVQLVFETPPPPPPPPPPQQQQQQQQPPQPQPPKMETGRLSSVETGALKSDNLGRAPDPVPQPSAGQPQQDPSETQTATTTPPPLPIPKPTPPKEHSAFQLPKPSGAQVPRHDETPRDAAHSARYAGPAASRDEYLAYLVTLTRQHIDLLPMSIVGDRKGETVISVVVYDNGRIGPLGVLHSSGYPDIDERIEKMVAAVGKFPPLPQWYQGNAVQLELTLRFPEALERTQ